MLYRFSLAEELVAERSGGQSGDDRSERRQHQHQRPVRLRRQAHAVASATNRLNEFTFHFQDFQNEILGVTDDPILIFPTPGLRLGPAPNTPQATSERKFQFRDDFSWFKGNHGLKFGTNYIHTEARRLLLLRRVRLRAARGSTIRCVITTNTARYPQGFATPGRRAAAQLLRRRGDHTIRTSTSWRSTRRTTGASAAS